MKLLWLAAGVVLLAAPAARAAEDGWAPWETTYEERGLKVEARKRRATGVVQTRATAVLPCATDVLWPWITTPEPYTRLMPKTVESRHLQEWPERGELLVYQRVDGSPSSDRDYTLRVRFTIEETARGKRYHRAWAVERGSGPAPVKGVVRVEVNEGHWTLQPTADGRTSFQYVNYMELGGSLWTSLANGASKDSARDFLKNLDAACGTRTKP